MDQNEVVGKVQDILSRYGYSYRLRVVNAPDGRYVWITLGNSGYDIKVEPTEVACVWYFENGEEYAGRMSYEGLVDWLPGSLEDELIGRYAVKEKPWIQRMRREYV